MCFLTKEVRWVHEQPLRGQGLDSQEQTRNSVGILQGNWWEPQPASWIFANLPKCTLKEETSILATSATFLKESTALPASSSSLAIEKLPPGTGPWHITQDHFTSPWELDFHPPQDRQNFHPPHDRAGVRAATFRLWSTPRMHTLVFVGCRQNWAEVSVGFRLEDWGPRVGSSSPPFVGSWFLLVPCGLSLHPSSVCDIRVPFIRTPMSLQESPPFRFPWMDHLEGIVFKCHLLSVRDFILHHINCVTTCPSEGSEERLIGSEHTWQNYLTMPHSNWTRLCKCDPGLSGTAVHHCSHSIALSFTGENWTKGISSERKNKAVDL